MKHDDVNAKKLTGDGSGITNLALSDTGKNMSSTAWLDGCITSIDGGNTTVSVGAGNGRTVNNYTDTNLPDFNNRVFAGDTGVTPIGVALSLDVTFFFINGTNVLQQQLSPITESQRRDVWWSGFAVHLAGGLVTEFKQSAVLGTDINLSVVDFQTAVGTVSKGMAFKANGANLFLDRNVGTYSLTDINSDIDKKAPNSKIFAEDLNTSWNYSYQSVVQGEFITVPNQTTVNVALYDDGSGTLAAVTNNSWTVQRIFFFSNGDTAIAYGQETYNSIEDAIVGISADEPVTNPFFQDDALRCFLIVRGGGSDLSIAADAGFRQTGRFGNIGTSGAAGTGTPTTTVDTFTKTLHSSATLSTLSFFQKETGFTNNTWSSIDESLQLIGIEVTLDQWSASAGGLALTVQVKSFDLDGTNAAPVSTGTGTNVATGTVNPPNSFSATRYGVAERNVVDVQVDGSVTPKGLIAYVSATNLTTAVGGTVTLTFKRN